MTTISKRDAWLLASRPKTLPAAVAPVLVGVGLAIHDDVLAILPALAALLGALLLQVGVNLANDYFDFMKGVDSEERRGPTRVTQSGLIPPEQVRLGMIVIFGLSVLNGSYLIVVGGWPILAVGVLSILAALAYSGGPYPLASHGLGDLAVFIFFGLFAVCGTYYVQALDLTPLVVLAALPPGFLITAILVVNNLRDIETDRKAGKTTLAVLLGEPGARLEYVLLLIGALLGVIALWLLGFGWPVLIALLTIPLHLRLIRAIYGPNEGPHMNLTLAQTAQLALIFCALMALGIALA
ncbi:MAG: 1,4-dihydroxy-2-naphthoate polyprenyltransferase [Chloroflexi bacterium]|nr:1,4-dihydroxy-2-naphthoate polyprenyltransferase [Chloroflexota bacterium]